MEKYTNEFGRECYKDVNDKSAFSVQLFHKGDYQVMGDESYALHTNLGSLTVVARMTGYGNGLRDIESGFRSPDGEFWLASCDCDVRESGANNIREAINWVKERANTCVGKESK